jgi:DNA-directed RNA polymerase subunit RPC12/RpoP
LVAEDWSLPIAVSPSRMVLQPESRNEMNQCQYCGKNFAVPATLEAHVAGVHFKTKRYKCSACGMDFTYKNNVYRHRKTCKGLVNK